ncbi:LOW QUALITY PROTEIN: hypothetical protein JCM24511_05691 [Saitozyma sp. JCM 24511]|nr:LOW QUALITY PROTEIN: hypothetical protein JCM24511_05691 [Saitozyma sp. JCM 24511]
MPRLRPDYQRAPKRLAYLRSSLPVIALILLFSFFLSSLALLSHFRSPAKKQQIGWQSWDVVESGQSSGGGGWEDEDVTLGNGTDSGGGYVPSIPIDTWVSDRCARRNCLWRVEMKKSLARDPLALHTTGLTEIAVKPCYFPPWLFPSYCAPETTPDLDKNKGKWVIVEKDLNVRTGLCHIPDRFRFPRFFVDLPNMTYLNVYYRRTRRMDVALISDLRIVPEPAPENMAAELEGWTKAEGDLHSGVWPKKPELGLWYKTKEQTWNGWRGRSNRADEVGSEAARQYVDDADIITEVDVVYGDGPAFYGFERVAGGKIMEAEAQRWESVDLAFRRGTPWPAITTVPTFHADGTFKIMQIADLHYSVGTGECKDTDKSPCVGDEDTAAWLAEALDRENPDLVVFSGDQLNGQDTSYDSRSVLAKFAKPVIDREIPWCAIFGNHDSEINDDREYQMRTLQNMPFSLAEPGPKDVDGVGNYFLKLHSADASRMHLFTLYFIDSHDYQKKSLPWLKSDYDYIKTSQIEWFLNVSSSIAPIERPFTPDGAEDLGDIWHRSPSTRSSPARLPPSSRQSKTLAKPNAIMWFHIPLPEAYNPPDVAGFDGEELDVGSAFDRSGASKHNSGFFYNAIKQAFETDDDAADEDGWFGAKKTTEVKVLSHGHSHNTDRCRRSDGVWTCFDGGSSYSGYGQLGFDRRVRVYQLSEYGEKIETYKRLTNGEVIDKQVLVGPGAAEGWGQDQV